MTAGEIIDPDVLIIDPHHHLYPNNHWSRTPGPYLLPEFAADLHSGHKVISTVYVEASQLYRKTGPEHLRATGEAEFVAVIGRMSDTGHFGPTRICEAFVGRADLMRGAAVAEELDALIHASDGRLRGIRFSTAWDPDPKVSPSSRALAAAGLMAEPALRKAVKTLTRYGLVYEAWQLYPQAPELCDLADALPDTTFVSGHCGGLVGLRAYAGSDNFGNWRRAVTELAKRPNVVMKLGGLANDRTGFGFGQRTDRLSEEALVALWGPYLETCIELFGADRCMFESDFPVDSIAADYATLWNVFKRVAAGCSADEKAQLFAGVARRIYKLS